eukprot:scaffold10341_cov80-Isochrysis_galbana.AAC.2
MPGLPLRLPDGTCGMDHLFSLPPDTLAAAAAGHGLGLHQRGSGGAGVEAGEACNRARCRSRRHWRERSATSHGRREGRNERRNPDIGRGRFGAGDGKEFSDGLGRAGGRNDNPDGGGAQGLGEDDSKGFQAGGRHRTKGRLQGERGAWQMRGQPHCLNAPSPSPPSGI